MPENPAGHCPLCGTEMYQKGSFVICPEGDYKALFEKWDIAWIGYDAYKDSADDLIARLIALNLIKVVHA